MQPRHSSIGARRLAELIGSFDEHDGTSIHRLISNRIRALIIDGRVPVGTRLPSERELAPVLGRSRSTITAAYDLLRQTDYARSRQGSGTLAALPASAETGPIDFAHAVPAPLPGIGDYVQRAAADPDRLLRAPGFDMLGDEELRAQLAARCTLRGVRTGAGEVMVTAGAQHAMSLLARALLRRGDRVLMDSPCYPHAYEAFRAAGARVVTTPVTRDGWDGEHLIDTILRVRPSAAFLMPDFQNPTGASMPPRLRAAVVEAAARTGTRLIVDETTADLDIDRNWTDGTFARHAVAGSEIITIGSLGKSIWSGLRLGWIRADASTIAELTRRRPAFDMGSPVLEQAVARELIPDLEALLQTRSGLLRAGRDQLVSELRDALPDWDTPVPNGGLSLWVSFERPIGTALSLLARTKGLAISAGPRFTLDGSQERFLRLPYTEPASALSRGISLLAEVYAAIDPRPHPLLLHPGTML